jgi:hypothetical protein
MDSVQLTTSSVQNATDADVRARTLCSIERCKCLQVCMAMSMSLRVTECNGTSVPQEPDTQRICVASQFSRTNEGTFPSSDPWFTKERCFSTGCQPLPVDPLGRSRWVWSICGMLPTGKNRCPQCHNVRHKSYTLVWDRTLASVIIDGMYMLNTKINLNYT